MAVHRRVVIAVVLFSLCGMLGLYLKGREGEYRMPVLPKRLPEKETGWEYTTFHTVLPKDVRGGDVILRAYRRPGGPIISLMALFSPKGNYHPPSLCYRGRGLVLSATSAITSASSKIRLVGFSAHDESRIYLVYHGYYIAGRIIPDGVEKKVYEVAERIMHGHVRQYFFEVMLTGEKGDKQFLTSYLMQFINDIEPYMLDVAG